VLLWRVLKNRKIVHGAAATTIHHHMHRIGKEPLTIQIPTTAQPEANTSAHPTAMQSHIMPPSVSVILQPNIVEESVPETPSRVQPVVHILLLCTHRFLFHREVTLIPLKVMITDIPQV
jgi:hypothetical protein